jgi:hypothetical protein
MSDHPITSKGCEDYQHYYLPGEIHSITPSQKTPFHHTYPKWKKVKKIVGYLIIFSIFSSLFVWNTLVMHMPFYISLGIYGAAFGMVGLIHIAVRWIMEVE